MHFEGGLREGATGGHGPIRYVVAQLEPGRLVRFRLLAPRGLDGDHWFEVVPVDASTTTLRHGIVGCASGAMRWQWPLLWGPLHDALLEDTLARGEAAVTGGPAPTIRWSRRVRLLRRLARRRA